MTVEDRIREYYDSLRSGRPLEAYVRDDAFVKIGVEETLTGPAEIADGLREQRRTTSDWAVDSHELRTDVRGSYALFRDRVTLAWTAEASGDRHTFETRWSGTLVRGDADWEFVSIHVSAPHEL